MSRKFCCWFGCNVCCAETVIKRLLWNKGGGGRQGME